MERKASHLGSWAPEATALCLYSSLQCEQEQPAFPWLTWIWVLGKSLEGWAPRRGWCLCCATLAQASRTENATRQNFWLTQIALMSGTPAFILHCQKSSIRAIQNTKQTMGKQARVQSMEKKKNFFLPELVFAYGFLISYRQNIFPS